MASDLPCDADGVCMVCKAKPTETEAVLCRTCVTPWHVPCLSRPPETLVSALEWQCPDCCQSPESVAGAAAPALVGKSAELVAAIRAIEADGSLKEQEKARRRQALVSGGVGDLTAGEEVEEDGKERKKAKRGDDVSDLLDGSIYCSFCMQLPERPVTIFALGRLHDTGFYFHNKLLFQTLTGCCLRHILYRLPAIACALAFAGHLLHSPYILYLLLLPLASPTCYVS